MTHFGIVTVWQTCLGWVWQTFQGIFWHCWFLTCSGTCWQTCWLKSTHCCFGTVLHFCWGTDSQLFTGFCFTTIRHSWFWTWRHSLLKKQRNIFIVFNLIMSFRSWTFKDAEKQVKANHSILWMLQWMVVHPKVPKSNFQSEFHMSRNIRIFFFD